MFKMNNMVKMSLILICLLCVIMYLTYNNNNNTEGFENELNDLENKVLSDYDNDLKNKTPEELRKLVAGMKLRLDKNGLSPDVDMSKYLLKTEFKPEDQQRCTVANAEDRDKYVHKSDLPDPSPQVDLSKYVLKSSIPPEKVCPPQKEIDYSKYVLKSSLPANQKCPPCICPKVKVSAGLCKKCPPPPKCPAPEPCPKLTCPEPAPCEKDGQCPDVKPCPVHKEKVRYDVKYIKVPTVITKTVMVDQNGKVLKQKVETDADVPKKQHNIVKKPTLSGYSNNKHHKTLDNPIVEVEEEVQDVYTYNIDLNSQYKETNAPYGSLLN